MIAANLQVTQQTSQIESTLLCVPIFVWTDVLKPSVRENGIVIL